MTLRRAPEVYRREARDAAERAEEAGAASPLTWMGIGMTSIVLCGAEYHAWKVGRHPEDPTNYRMLEDEADWLRAARGLKHVPELYAFHPDQVVVERECVWGKAGSWSNARELFLIHDELRTQMVTRGWTVPEFKEDSFVKGQHGWMLVDCGFAQRIGETLLEYTIQCLEGRRRELLPPNDLAYYVYREVGFGLDKQRARPVLHALRDLGATEWTEI